MSLEKMMSSVGSFGKKVLASAIITGSALLNSVGCGGDDVGSSGSIFGQVSFTYYYTGAADPINWRKLEENVEGLRGESDVIKSYFSGGYTRVWGKNFSPGRYTLDSWWDVQADGWPNTNEPKATVDFDIVAGQRTYVNVYLQDTVPPSTQGSIVGNIQYNGIKTGAHKLYARAVDLNFNLVSEGDVRYPFIVDKSVLSSGGQNYWLGLPPGGPYYAFAWWDADDSNSYTPGDPREWFSGAFKISPGLSELEINISLNDP